MATTPSYYVPAEIVSHILSSLPSRDDREDCWDSQNASQPLESIRGTQSQDLPTAHLATLRAVSLSSKTMYAIAKEHMYSQFFFHEHERPGLTGFLRAILQEPPLGHKLRSISCGPKFWDVDECKLARGSHQERLARKELEGDRMSPIMRCAFGITGLHDPKNFGHLEGSLFQQPLMSHLKIGCRSAQFVLLLCHAPKLEILTVACLDTTRPQHSCFILEMIPYLNKIHASTQMRPLSKLRKIVLQGCELGSKDLELSRWSSLAGLPSLERLHLYGANLMARRSFMCPKFSVRTLGAYISFTAFQ